MLRESCGNAAVYFDPNRPSELASASSAISWIMRRNEKISFGEALKLCQWDAVKGLTTVWSSVLLPWGAGPTTPLARFFNLNETGHSRGAVRGNAGHGDSRSDGVAGSGAHGHDGVCYFSGYRALCCVMARKSLIGKARQRPQDVKRVLQKLRYEGIRSTLRQVSARLDEPMPLGYSASGVVIECSAGVQEFKPGDRIAAAAPHSAVSVAGRNLCAIIPNNVSFEQAAYTSIAAIALQGVRLTEAGLGDSVVVLVRTRRSDLCQFAKSPGMPGLRNRSGSSEARVGANAGRRCGGYPVDHVQAVKEFTGSRGADAVVITAATESNEPIEFAAEVCRVKGRVVLVGVVGLNLPDRRSLRKNSSLQFPAPLVPAAGTQRTRKKASITRRDMCAGQPNATCRPYCI